MRSGGVPAVDVACVRRQERWCVVCTGVAVNECMFLVHGSRIGRWMMGCCIVTVRDTGLGERREWDRKCFHPPPLDDDKVCDGDQDLCACEYNYYN